MQLKSRHISLLAGILAIFVSLLFYGHAMRIYNSLVWIGILVVGISFLRILFSNEPSRNKLFWTALSLGFAAVSYVAEPWLVKTSYLIFVRRNEKSLSNIVKIMTERDGNRLWVADSALWKRNLVLAAEGKEILSLVKNLNFYSIRKTSNYVYFYIDQTENKSHGVYFYYNTKEPISHRTLIKDSWYF